VDPKLDQKLDQKLERMAARGELAGGVTAELADPLARVRDALEGAIELLDHHIARAHGPEPLPYPLIGQLRERIAEAFLDAGRAARLAAVLGADRGVAATMDALDVNEVVDRAVTLARHRLDGVDVLVDLGTLPPVRGDGARLAQALAHLILPAAEAGRVEVKTFLDGDVVVVTVSHAGVQHPRFSGLVEENVAGQGGQLTSRRDGELIVHEIRLPALAEAA
jgi:C4-dicarboxylate-specific signal transduction histidine kinase